jgi:V8-like Glu-specific endopeptidase
LLGSPAPSPVASVAYGYVGKFPTPDGHTATGTLIDPKHVLTAAHALQSSSRHSDHDLVGSLIFCGDTRGRVSVKPL